MTGWVLLVVVIPLALAETGELAPWLAARCIRFGTRLLPTMRARERFTEEWCAGLDRVPGKLTKLCFAAGIVAIAVPTLRLCDRRAEREVPGLLAACERAVSSFENADSVQNLAELVALSAPAAIGFRDAAIGFEQPEGDYKIIATGGSPSLRAELLGTRVPRGVLELGCQVAEKWGTLCFLTSTSFEVFDQGGVAVHQPPAGSCSRHTPDAWNVDYGLMAPMYDSNGHMIGKISLDLPVSERCPGPAQRVVIERYTGSAAKKFAQLNAQAASKPALGLV
ncbi:MAG TPA: hypothetical protein VL551_04040 [Actinospica sp.]|nr:hypothetical protein [Actinospica sp.]